MKKILLFLLACLSTITTYSQDDTKIDHDDTPPDSLVYTPMRLMGYMLVELDECDSLKIAHENVKIQMQEYRDASIKLGKEVIMLNSINELNTDNVNNAEDQLFKAEKVNEKLIKQRNNWRIIAAGAIILGTIINLTNNE